MANSKSLSRAGKATGKYASWFNTEEFVTKKTSGIEFKNDIDEWKILENEHLTQSGDALMANVIPTEAASIREAKIKELNNWKSFHVYDEVSDQGQCYLTTGCVITEKESCMKAKLVVRDLKEESEVQTNSPTAAKDTIRLFFALSSALKWAVESMDVKSRAMKLGVRYSSVHHLKLKYPRGSYGN